MSLKLVSAILGHSATSITADIYGHAPDSAQRAALDALQSQLSGQRQLFEVSHSSEKPERVAEDSTE